MVKFDELTDPNSCMNRASESEMTFVLLARDAAAPVAIRAWIEERVRLGKNDIDDDEIKEAAHCAGFMEQQRRDGIGLDLRHGYPLGPGTIPPKVVEGPLPDVLPDLVPKKWEGE